MAKKYTRRSDAIGEMTSLVFSKEPVPIDYCREYFRRLTAKKASLAFSHECKGKYSYALFWPEGHDTLKAINNLAVTKSVAKHPSCKENGVFCSTGILILFRGFRSYTLQRDLGINEPKV